MIDPIDLPDLTGTFLAASSGYMSNVYYQTLPSVPSVTTVNTLGNGIVRATPWHVQRKTRFTRIGAEVTAAGDVGSVLRIGLYADNGKGYPGALIADYGTIAGDVVAIPELTIESTLESGLYWVAAVVQGVTATQPTFRGIINPVGLAVANVALSVAKPVAGTAANFGYAQFSVPGALPATFIATVSPTASSARIFVKTA